MSSSRCFATSRPASPVGGVSGESLSVVAREVFSVLGEAVVPEEVATQSGFSGEQLVGGHLFPGFVPRHDACAIVALTLTVGTGRFVGAVYSELLLRSEARCKVISLLRSAGADGVGAAYAYRSAVAEVEEQCFPRAEDFFQAVAELAVTSVTVGGSSRAQRVFDVLSTPGSDGLLVRSVGSHVAVVGSAEVGLTQVPVDEGMVAIPRSVYKELVRTGVDVQGGTVRVTLRRQRNGVFVVSRDYDAADSYPIGFFPEGACELPGAYGLVVPTSLLSEYCAAVLALPRLMMLPGYCFLGCLPPASRWAASQALGKDPFVGVLGSSFPEAYDWSDREALYTVTAVSLTGCRDVHVVRPGTLPKELGDRDRVGSGRAPVGVGPVEKFVDDAIDEILAGVGTAGRVEPFRGRSASSSSYASRPFSPSGSAGAVSLPGVGRLVPIVASYKPTWQVVESPVTVAWAERLSEGPPVGAEALRALSGQTDAGQAGPPPRAEGTSVLLPVTSVLAGANSSQISWKPVRVPLAGWSMERVSYSRSNVERHLVASHPEEGVLCRYELSCSDSNVVLPGGVEVWGRRSVVWSLGQLEFHFKGSGVIYRMWNVDGAAGVGSTLYAVAHAFACPAVRYSDPQVRADRVIGLDLDSRDSHGNLVRYTKKVKMRGVKEKFHLYISDETVAEPAVLSVRCGSLRSIEVHTVKVWATAGFAKVAVVCTQTSVSVATSQSASSHAGFTVDFELVCVRQPGAFSGAVVEQGMRLPQTRHVGVGSPFYQGNLLEG